MENLTLPLLIILFGLVVAAITHYVLNRLLNKGSATRHYEDNVPVEDVVNKKYVGVPKEKTSVSLGVWEGVKFGIGLGIGLIITSIIFWTLAASIVIASLEAFLKGILLQ